jgi:diguanylate cyclase (GGDEF)-like protein/PAS domain S-box-containing protein
MSNDLGVEGELTWMLDVEQFRSVVANVPGVVYRSECREPWRMVFISDYVESLLGYPPSEFLGDATVTFGDLLHPEDRDRINELLDDVLERQSSYSIDYRLIRADGSIAWVEEHGRVSREEDGSPLWLDGVIFDASRRKEAEDARDRAEAELRHQALHDPLTGLPNRALVLERAKELITGGEDPRPGVALLFIDLDNFKQVNDEFGHHAGDELLRQVAERLASAVRTSDIIGRVGGDEFIVILEGPSLGKRAEDIAQRVNEVLARPFALDEIPGVPLRVSATIGAAVGGASAEEILRNADVALYQAKAASKGSHTVFTPGMKAPGQQKTI